MNEEKTISLRLKQDFEGERYVRQIGVFRIEAEKDRTIRIPADRAGLVLSSGDFELVEPELAKSDLPADFPARKILFDADLKFLSQVRDTSDADLIALDGIGEKTLAQIRQLAPYNAPNNTINGVEPETEETAEGEE